MNNYSPFNAPAPMPTQHGLADLINRLSRRDHGLQSSSTTPATTTNIPQNVSSTPLQQLQQAIQLINNAFVSSPNGVQSTVPWPQQSAPGFNVIQLPVGSSSNDESLLVNVLYQAKKTGQTHLNAINGLNGVNQHSAAEWKDYFLAHHDRIESVVTRLSDKGGASGAARMQPQNSGHSGHAMYGRAQSREGATMSNLSSHHQPVAVRARKAIEVKTKDEASSDTRITEKGEEYYASLSNRRRAAVASKRDRLPATRESSSDDIGRDRSIGMPIPPVPSRSPSPPTSILPAPRGNQFTAEDSTYLVDMFLWTCKNNPSVSKNDVFELLGQKAPHHSASSWQSHAQRRYADILNRILKETRSLGEHDDNEEEISSADENVVPAGSSEQSQSPDQISWDSSPEVEAASKENKNLTCAELLLMASHVSTLRSESRSLLLDPKQWNQFADKNPTRSSKEWARCCELQLEGREILPLATFTHEFMARPPRSCKDVHTRP
ncbi:hypothetical protein K474DRAFT_850750 [Panus rudis PR-1116 ss-1]|nr:hypothetical protein K474DRAFT_850750 [Panus rudis PR-1116 ss-1]